MAIDAGTIYSSIRIRLDKLQTDLNSVNYKLNNFSKQSQTRAGKFQGAWQAAFTAIGFLGVQAFTKLLQAGRNAIKTFSDFQQSMRNTQSVTGAVGEEMRILEDAAKAAGETTRFTARQAADALYFLGSAGFSARQSVYALNGVLQLAGATQSDLATTAESVASIISQYSLKAEEASRVSNVFAAAIGNSQATMDKLTNAFRQVGPVAAGLGISLEQTTGALQLLFNAGFRGQQAGRALKSAFADLASPTANIAKVFGKLGIELDKVNPETQNFSDILDVLQKSGISTAQIIDAFGKVSGPQLAVLIKQGGDALRSYTDDVTGTNAATEAYAIQNDSLAGSLDFLRSKLESVAIEIIGKMEPGMRDLIDSFINFLDATKPVGVLLGNILNFILQITGIPLKALTKGMEVLTGIFKTAESPFKTATAAIEETTKAIEEAGKIQQTADRLSRLTDEYEKLSSKADKTQGEQDRLKQVISDIADIVPDAATAWDDYGEALDVSTEKSRQAAKQLLENRRSLLEASISALRAEEPLLLRLTNDRNKRIISEIKAEKRKAEESARIRVSSLNDADRFFSELERLEKQGIVTTDIFNKLLEDQQFTLGALGIKIKDASGNFRSYSQVITEVKTAQVDAEESLSNLQKILSKELKVEQEYEDAAKKLEELNRLQKELQQLIKGINNLDKIDPIDDNAPKKVDELGQVLEDFWVNYKKGLQDATIDASLFGDIQDELSARLDFLKKSIIELVKAGIDPNTISVQKLKMEYDLTLAVLTDYIEKEKEALELEKQRERDQNKLNDTISDYTRKLEELGKTDEQLIELERKRAIETVEALKLEDDAIQKAIDTINEYYDALKSTDAADEFELTTEKIISKAENLASALISLSNSIVDNRIADLDRQLQQELEVRGLLEETESQRLQREIQEAEQAGNTTLALEKRQDLERLQVIEEFERKKSLLQYKAAFAEWLLKVASVGASAADAIMKAWSTGNPFWIGLNIAAAGVQGAAVLAAKPQPPSFQTGGVFINPSSGTEGSQAILHSPEMVLNTDQMTTLFNAIKSGNINNTGQMTHVTVIYQVDSVEVARSTANVMNNGIVTLKPRAIR